MTRELAHGFTAEVDEVDSDSWHEIMGRFDDAYIYQTWAYEAVHSGEERLSHLVLKREGRIVAAAQARVMKLPVPGMGVAYLRWAPMWRLKGRERDLDVFAQALRALRNEYVVKRRLALRILPLLFDEEADVFGPIFAEEGFGRPIFVGTQKTLLIDLSKSEEDLRKGLHEKWRYNLKLGERHKPTVLEGDGDELFPLFIQTYRNTVARKGFLETSDINEFRRVQQDLPQEFRLRVFVALLEDVPAAGVICSKIGSTGLFLFGGTSDAALDSRASYLLNWRAMNWLKEQGARSYNLAGINPVTNPGTYRFKTGLSGRNGREVCSMGAFDAYGGFISGTLFRCADIARELQRRARMMLARNKVRTSTG